MPFQKLDEQSAFLVVLDGRQIEHIFEQFSDDLCQRERRSRRRWTASQMCSTSPWFQLHKAAQETNICSSLPLKLSSWPGAIVGAKVKEKQSRAWGYLLPQLEICGRSLVIHLGNTTCVNLGPRRRISAHTTTKILSAQAEGKAILHHR